MLSQEEINALLNDTFGKTPSDKEANADASLSLTEIDTLGEIANISMGSAATALSSLLGQRVEITTPHVSVTSLEDFRKSFDKPMVIVDVNFNKGLKGTNVLIVQPYDAGVIVDLMMGGDGNNPPLELNDLHLSAVSEAMNQMMGASCTSLSQILSKRIDITPPVMDMYDVNEYDFACEDKDNIVMIAFHISIQNLIDSKMIQLLPISFAKNMVDELMRKNGLTETTPSKAPFQEEEDNYFNKKPEKGPVRISPSMPQANAAPPAKPVAVAPADFNQFTPESTPRAGQPNLELILDVGLQLSVELGRTTKRIKDILELTTGSILELDKLAGEPVDIIVNGKLLAKGEVVVIDENFGVRVTEIASPLERVKNFK